MSIGLNARNGPQRHPIVATYHSKAEAVTSILYPVEIAVLQSAVCPDFAINKVGCAAANARQTAVNSIIQSKPVCEICIPALALAYRVSNNTIRVVSFSLALSLVLYFIYTFTEIYIQSPTMYVLANLS